MKKRYIHLNKVCSIFVICLLIMMPFIVSCGSSSGGGNNSQQSGNNGNSGGSGGSGGSSDTTQPTVSSAGPLAEVTDVDVSTLITVTFSEPMDGSTITTGTFTLNSNPPVSGTVSYNSGTNTATFTPDTNLDYMTAYTATITTGVTDLAGNPMEASYTWSFTTTAAGTGASIDLPETGQTTCYDDSGNVIICSHTGQDGDIRAGVAWPSPRFTDNGDGTMTDNLTGLMWLRNANCISSEYPAFGIDGIAGNGAVTWQHALDFVAGINDGTYTHCGAGYTDWRLPNVNELESLVNLEESNIATWLADQGFTNLQLVAVADLESNHYWSSTSKANREIEAYRVHMKYGGMGYVNKRLNEYVWPVRAETALPAQLWKTGQTISYAAGDDGDLQKGVAWPSPRFTENGDGTVTDNLTKLMWTADASTPGPAGCNGGVKMHMQWQESLNYVACLNTNRYLGYNDWRMPNRKELHSLIDFSQVVPSLPSGHPFSNVYVDYSSSTTYAFGPDYEWDVTPSSGFHHIGLKIGFGGSGHPVWPVRAGQ
jgi:hypothetical protein